MIVDLVDEARDSYLEQLDPEKSEYECFFHYDDEELYFAGFREGYELAVMRLLKYIENDCECAIPIKEMFNEDGTHITKKKYGHVLLKYLVKEIKAKYAIED